MAQGRLTDVKKQWPAITDNGRAIKEMLLKIRASHGSNDPLGLQDLWDEHNYYQDCARMEELQKAVPHDFDVIGICEHEKKLDTVTVLIPDGLPKDGESRRYNLLSVANLSAMPRSQYRVKNVLPGEGLSAIFGPPGAGKTFVALDLAFAISDGRDWFGNQVKACPVLYICLEGQSGLSHRAQAYRVHHGEDAGEKLNFVIAPFSLLFNDDIDALVATVNEAGIQNGVIFIDTLSAASPGADENSSADMGRILEAAKRIREECGGLVILVHHSGKDASKGLRGHSSLPAALDTVIHVSRGDDRRAWALAKSKDGIESQDHAFRLSTIELGTDEDGDPISSCVVVQEVSAVDSFGRIKRPKGGNQKIVFDVAGELLRKSPHYGKGGSPASRPCIRLDDLIEACHGRLTVPEDRWRERTRLAITGLVNAGCLMLRENWVWDR